MTVIAATEDAMVAAIAALLGNRVRTVDTVPASFSTEELADRLRLAPAVYVGFIGGASRDENAAVIDADFVVYALTQNASGERARRRGDATAIGAYEIIEAVAPALHGMAITAGAPPVAIDGTGTLSFTGINNLWAEQLDAEGVSLYSANFRVVLTFTAAAPGDLGDFETFSAQWDIAPQSHYRGDLPAPGADVDATQIVTLPQ